jgi:hypothetical protein
MFLFVRSLVGLPVFKETFGYNRDGKYIIAAKWLSAFGMHPLTSSPTKSCAGVELKN